MADVTTAQPQMSTANQSPASSPDMSQINPQLLAQLISAAQLQQGQNTNQTQGAMSLPNGGVGNTQGQQLNPMHQAMIDGATAGLKKSAQEATQTAGLPAAQHIFDLVNQASAQNGIGTSQVQSPNILPPVGAFQNTAYNPQTGQIQEGGWANRGLRGLATGGVPGLLQGLLGPSLGAQMGATRESQILKAGQPADIALPQAQAGEAGAMTKSLQQKMEGKEPLQAKDYADIMGGLNSLNLDSLKTASQKMDDDLKERQTEIDTSQKTINMMGRLGGMFNNSGTTVTKATQKAQDEIVKLKAAKAAVDAKIATFQPRNPLTAKIELNAPAGSAHYSPSTGKYYDAQGQEL